MRCNSCEKFVSYDEDTEPEMDDEGEVSDGTYRAEVSRILNCGECGDELKRGTFSFEQDFASDLEEADQECKGYEGAEPPEDFDADAEDGEHEWTVESEAFENNDRTVTEDRNGKKIKSARYMKTMRGVVGNITVKCEKCGLTHDFSVSDEMPSSGMDESQ